MLSTKILRTGERKRMRKYEVKAGAEVADGFVEKNTIQDGLTPGGSREYTSS